MKLTKNASGKTTIKMTQAEWMDIGKKSGWTKTAAVDPRQLFQDILAFLQQQGVRIPDSSSEQEAYTQVSQAISNACSVISQYDAGQPQQQQF